MWIKNYHNIFTTRAAPIIAANNSINYLIITLLTKDKTF